MSELDRTLSWTPRVGDEVFLLRRNVRARGRIVEVGSLSAYCEVDAEYEHAVIAWFEELALFPTTADEVDALLERIRELNRAG